MSATAEESEARYQAEVHDNLPRNYAAHLFHGIFGQTGFRLVQAPTFLEAYIHSISSAPLALGAVRACQALGMFLSPILGATSIEHRKRVLPVGFWIGGLMRLQLLGIAAAAFFLPGELALYAVAALLMLFGFFMGMQGVIFSFLMSKLIPVSSRGRLIGIRQALAGIVAGGTGWVGGRLVDSDALGNGFAATFLLAFVLTSLGLACLAFVREPQPPELREPSRVGDRLRELPALLRSDPAFTRYFLARALATMGRMSTPFYVPFAMTRFDIGGRELGVLTLAFVTAMSAGNLVWGSIADRTGFRFVFLAAIAVWIGSTLLLLTTTTESALVAVLAGLGVGQGGFMMSAQALVLEFGSRANLPMRIAVANTASEGVGVVAPLAGGVLATFVSPLAVFWTAIAFQATALVWVALFVRDPRHS